MRIKKIFSLLLIVTMLGSLIPSTVLAENRSDTKPELTKKAEWVDKETGLAKITLETKGNPVVIPKKGADVVVVMDYSGSMETATSKSYEECGNSIVWSFWYRSGRYDYYSGKCAEGHEYTTTVPRGQIPPEQNCTKQFWKVNETRWQAAKKALDTLLGQILSSNNGDSKVAFVAFDSQVRNNYTKDFTNNSTEIMNLVNSLSDPSPGTGKGTNYTDSLNATLNYLNSRSDKTRPTYVVFLTDGAPDSGKDGSAQIKSLKKISKIYTIGFALNPSTESGAISRLTDYASQPEYFRNVQTSSELDNLFDNIGESIANPGVTVWDTIDTRYFTVAQKQGTNISHEVSAGAVEYTNGKTFSWHLDNFSTSGETLKIYVQLKSEYRKTGQSYPTNEVGTARGTYIDSDGIEKTLPVTEDNISTSVPKLPTNKVHQVIFDKGEHGKLKDQDTNGQIVINNILSGSPFPTKPEIIANPGYQFTGWSPTLPSNVTEDQIYVAQYTKSTENWKTVTFTNGNHGTLENQDTEGKVVIEDILVGSNFPEAPKVSAEKGYRFIGWNETLPDKVTETKTYTAVYEKVATDWKTITFVNGEHGTLENQDTEGKVVLGDILVGSNFPKAPKVSAEKGYKFTGWNPVVPTTVTETATYVAQYEKIAEDWKTITFVNGEHGTLENQTTEGKVVLSDILVGSNFPEAPKVSAEKGYKFTGWNPVVPTIVTETATYVAQYEKVAEDWKTITFDKGAKGTLAGQNTNGQVVVENALVGEAFPTAPEITVEKGYKFTGWSPVLPNVVEETKVYIAQYEKVDSDWKTVTFAKGNHGKLEGEDRDGQIVIPDILLGSNFPKAPKVSVEKGYKFTGWSPSTTATVTETKTYVAQYEKVAEDWKTVIFEKGTNGTLENQNAEGKVVIGDILVDSSFPTEPKVTPEKGYKFTGWSPSTTATVTETKTYVAQYEKVAEDWKTVTFEKGTNGTLENQDKNGQVVIGDILVDSSFPAEPKVTPEKGYKFTGWSPSTTATVTETKTYVAQYEKVAEDWKTVTFEKGINGTLENQNAEGKVVLGDILVGSSFPESPKVTPEKGYKFTGWSPSTTATVTETKTYVAQYEKVAEDWKTITFDKGEKGTLVGQNTNGQVVVENMLVDTNFPTAPEVTVEKGYKFTGWSPVLPNVVEETKVYIAQYEKVDSDWKTVTFAKGDHGKLEGEDRDGQIVIPDILVGSNFPAEPKVTPEKGYKFTGWSPSTTATVTETATYVAQYEKVAEDWKTITFDKGEKGTLVGQNTNGQVVVENMLVDTSFPTAPEVTAEKGYKFTGWSPVLPNVVEETKVYIAQYEKVAEDWKTVTFEKGTNGTLENQDKNGQVVIEDILVGADFPAEPKVTPEKGYKFTGWSPSTTATVTETKTYVAQYEKVAEDWKTVTFEKGTNGTLENQNAEGKVVIGDILVDSSFPAEPKVTPEKGYKFTGWSPNATATVTETATYVAQYEKVAEDWKTVTFEKGTNGTLENQNTEGKVVVGDILIDSNFPAAPKVTAEKGYKFTGWNPVAPATVTETATYVAQYMKLPTVTFKVDSTKSNSAGKVIFVEPGTKWDDLSKPETPVGKEVKSDSNPNVYKKYEFVAWGEHPRTIENDEVVEAVFETYATIQQEEIYFKEGSNTPESSLSSNSYNVNKAESNFNYTNEDIKEHDGYIYKVSGKQVFVNGKAINSGDNNINFDLTSIQGQFPDETVHVKNIYKEIDRHYVVYQTESQDEVTNMPKGDDTIFYDGYNKQFIVSKVEPKRDGYTFIGWKPSAESSKVFKVGEQIVVSNKDFDFSQKNLIMQAAWEPNEEVWNYNVKYYKYGETEPYSVSENTVLKRSNKVTSISDRTPEYYKLKGYQFNDGEMSKTLSANITKDGQVIKVYYEKNDLIVKHVYGDVVIYDKEQSKADASDKLTIKSVNNGRYNRVNTLSINGVAQTPQTTITLDFTKDNKYEVVFAYGSKSGGSTTNPDDNTNTGGNPSPGGKDNGYFGEPVEILDEEVPLAAGLESIDHFAYVFGYEDNTARPKNKISREEVSTIFYRLMTDDLRESMTTLTQGFPDVKNTRWSNKPIATLANGKIIGGYPDGSFKPGSSITRAEFAAIVSRFDNLNYQGADKFSDIKGHWAAATINAAAERGWIGGYPDGTFRPNAYITRAEAMALINKVLNRHVSEKGLLPDARYWKDNSKNAWYYEDVMEATNSHDYTRDESTGIETWTIIKPDKVWP